MNQAMKQRLVGALVVGCLALIFIPWLLDGEGVHSPGVNASIPDEAQVSFMQPEAPQRPVIVADANKDNAANQTATENSENAISLPVPESASSTSSATDTPTANPDSSSIPQMSAAGLPEAWSVQMGIFGERLNAETLLKKLQKSEYQAYSRPVASAQGNLTGVFVGPVISRSEADNLQKELARKFELKGIVVKFTVDGQ